jgi:hypothetical protein
MTRPILSTLNIKKQAEAVSTSPQYHKTGKPFLKRLQWTRQIHSIAETAADPGSWICLQRQPSRKPEPVE